MKIERISRKDDTTVVVHLDNNEKLFLSYEILMKNGLKKGDEISDGRFAELITANQLYHIKQRAARYLSRRLHSTSELIIKLKQKGYDSSLIHEVVNQLTAANYLDDYRFALQYADENIRNKLWGKTKLKAELFRKGISAPVINKVISETFSDRESDYENALKLAEKKIKQIIYRTPEVIKQKQKLMSYLFSRGYDYETINMVVEQLFKNEE